MKFLTDSLGKVNKIWVVSPGVWKAMQVKLVHFTWGKPFQRVKKKETNGEINSIDYCANPKFIIFVEEYYACK